MSIKINQYLDLIFVHTASRYLGTSNKLGELTNKKSLSAGFELSHAETDQ